MKYPRPLKTGEIVRVYRNLHNGRLSIQGVNLNGNMSVVAHVDNATVIKAKFIVKERGRQRVLQEKRKNVHAFVEGYLMDWNSELEHNEFDMSKYKRVTYNPYRFSSFVDLISHEPVTTAWIARIENSGHIIATRFGV